MVVLSLHAFVSYWSADYASRYLLAAISDLSYPLRQVNNAIKGCYFCDNFENVVETPTYQWFWFVVSRVAPEPSHG
jgi:hypothetical protein